MFANHRDTLSNVGYVSLFSFQVNLETMEMFNPIKGKLRRTHHDGVFLKAVISEKDYAIHAKIGYVQVNFHTLSHFQKACMYNYYSFFLETVVRIVVNFCAD